VSDDAEPILVGTKRPAARTDMAIAVPTGLVVIASEPPAKPAQTQMSLASAAADAVAVAAAASPIAAPIAEASSSIDTPAVPSTAPAVIAISSAPTPMRATPISVAAVSATTAAVMATADGKPMIPAPTPPPPNVATAIAATPAPLGAPLVSHLPATSADSSGALRAVASKAGPDSSGALRAVKGRPYGSPPVREVGGSHPPVTTPHFDDDESNPDFFRKSVEDIHAEHARIEAPDLHDDVPLRESRRPKRVPDKHSHGIVLGLAALAAVVLLVGAGKRLLAPKPSLVSSATTMAEVSTASAATANAALSYDEKPLAIASASVTATMASVEPAPSVSASVAPSASVEVVASATPTTDAATTAPSTTTAASPSGTIPALPPDPDGALSGSQLLAAARAALNAGNNQRAAILARKSAAKGGGGSAYYVLGAAYESMGSHGAAKGAYQSCARSGCPEAGECASIAENM
jgi:hypothetical protein